MKIRLLTYAAAAVIMLQACDRKHEPDPVFLSGDVPCVTVDGTTVISYNDEPWQQLSFSEDNKQFRMSNDQMSEYFVVECNALPETEGQKIRADVAYTKGLAVKHLENQEFVVKKIDGDTVHLWCSKKKTGIIVRYIR